MANITKTICGISEDVLKKSPALRKALLQAKQKINSILVSEGKIAGAQTSVTKEAKAIYESVVKTGRKATTKGKSSVIKHNGRKLVPLSEYSGEIKPWKPNPATVEKRKSIISELEDRINYLYKNCVNTETNRVPKDIYYEIEKLKKNIKSQLDLLKTH